MRWRWGHGREESAGRSSLAAGRGSGAGIALWRGIVFVVEGLTWPLIKVETPFGVTLSMNVNAGRSRTVLEGSPSIIGESSGAGMLEAESILFYHPIYSKTLDWTQNHRRKQTHPICRHGLALSNGFHNATLLICDISDPIALSRRDNQMRIPPIHFAEQLVFLVDGRSGHVSQGARLAISCALLTVGCEIGFGKQSVHLSLFHVF